MRRWLKALSIVLLFAASASAQPAARSILFRDPARVYASSITVMATAATSKATQVERLTANSALVLNRRCDEISRTPGLRCEPDAIATLDAVPNDLLFPDPPATNGYGISIGQLNHLRLIDLRGWDTFQSQTGRQRPECDAPIAVIDSGVAYRHPDLAANIWTNPDEIAGNGIDDDHNGYIDDLHGYDFANNDNDPDDDQGHGTHVAGIIGAVGNNASGVTGVCWGAKLVALKFLNASGWGYYSDAIRAIAYATDKGIRVSNNSWGGADFSQALYDAMANAITNDHTFVIAAGNNGWDNSQPGAGRSYPAAFDLSTISVAAANSDGQRTYFSNYGSTVTVAAPGNTIPSTYPGDAYRALSGTSMAAPHIAGILGLMITKNRSLGHRELAETLCRAGYYNPGAYSRCGVTSLKNALDLTPTAQPTPTPTPSPTPTATPPASRPPTPQPTPARPVPFTIQGTISVDAAKFPAYEGKPGIKGARLELWLNEKLVGSRSTSAAGSVAFHFKALPSTRYELRSLDVRGYTLTPRTVSGTLSDTALSTSIVAEPALHTITVYVLRKGKPVEGVAVNAGVLGSYTTNAQGSVAISAPFGIAVPIFVNTIRKLGKVQGDLVLTFAVR